MDTNKIRKVKIIKSPFAKDVSPAKGEECEAVKLKSGWKVFHHTGWWLFPFDYCEEIGPAFN